MSVAEAIMSARPDLDGERILVMVYGHVADTIAAIPGLRSLRHAYPAARIEVLILSASAPILGNCPYVDELVVWQDLKRKGTALAKTEKLAAIATLMIRIRRRNYAAVIVFHRSFGFLRRLAASSGAYVVAGVSHGNEGYTHRAMQSARPESSRDENRRVLEALGM
jgi:heptosyltransferase II